jgi:hypothetical protein
VSKSWIPLQKLLRKIANNIMENEDNLTKKSKSAALLLESLKELGHIDKINSQVKLVLIESILEHDKHIQTHVEEDHPKNIDELNKLSIKELSKWSELRLTYLKHLIDKDTVN